MARLLKNTIEEEFSGFVKVFVSSDDESIRTGANFLKKIEQGLTNCVAAIYLISPTSIKHSWISFELGAIWIRSCLSENSGGPEIPALPFCHSGMTFGCLPQPISNLNAIQISEAPRLEAAFKSIQHSLGVNGRLRTDFTNLAKSISEIESQYTIGDKINEAFKILKRKTVLSRLETKANGSIYCPLGTINQTDFKSACQLIPESLRSDIKLIMDGSGVNSFEDGTVIIGGPVDLYLTDAGLKALQKYLNPKPHA